MSCETFDPDCRGCQPAIRDVVTGKVLADDSPEMVRVFAVWNDAAYSEQLAFWEVCVRMSNDPVHLMAARGLSKRIERALNAPDH